MILLNKWKIGEFIAVFTLNVENRVVTGNGGIVFFIGFDGDIGFTTR